MTAEQQIDTDGGIAQIRTLSEPQTHTPHSRQHTGTMCVLWHNPPRQVRCSAGVTADYADDAEEWIT